MDSLVKFASGFSSAEEFARNVYIKSNLTTELDRVVKQLVSENDIRLDSENRFLYETPTILALCDIIEAILLHGLKRKLSSRVSNVFGGTPSPKNSYSLDYWRIIQILCHNEESKQLKQLTNVYTDIGRCRAWLRSAFNESLFRCYFDMLIEDSSILNGFYSSSAYLRDLQQTSVMRTIIMDLDNYIFQFSIDNLDLNSWNSNTLSYIGVRVYDEDSTLVVTALDAIHLISEEFDKKEVQSNKQSSRQSSPIVSDMPQPCDDKYSPQPSTMTELHEECASIEESSVPAADENSLNNELLNECCNDTDEKENISHCSGNSLSVKSSWSTQPIIHDESYNALLESYSTRVALSSTPDINDIRHSISKQISKSASSESFAKAPFSAMTEIESIPNEVAPPKVDEDKKAFIEILSSLPQERGLDEQDYKCNACSRPVGLIYGKYNLCHIDGHLYCPECHCDEESIIPAQIMYNWNFKKFSVAKRNKRLLQSIESEPIFDIKLLSPLLYSVIPEMEEALDLRTQLFFLHAYLFTCQESIAIKMRKLVSPREHLFEHIHLYSINDLLQVYYNTLTPILRQVISFARKHIFSCELCKLKGYYCEICKDSHILYPFDTQTTRRCESCKSVFHLKCYEEKYNKSSCPKCLRLAKKRNL